MHLFIRNFLGFLGACVVYLVAGYLLHFLQFQGRSALLLLIVFHAGFGTAGYFIFTGRTHTRSLLVFSVVMSIGIVFEILRPDPRHDLVQVFVAIPFGILAASTTPIGRFVEKRLNRSKVKDSSTQ